MGLLDANTPQIQTSSAGTSDMASMMRGTMARAEGTAQQAMAYHQGESSMAFQTAHARFVEAAAKALLTDDPSHLPLPVISGHAERFTTIRQAYYETGAALTHLTKPLPFS